MTSPMISRRRKQAVSIHRSCAWAALLGLGVWVVPQIAAAAEEAESSEAAVSAPATPDAPAIEVAPAPQPAEPAVPSRAAPMPAPEPIRLAALPTETRAFVYDDGLTPWGVWLDLDHLYLTRDNDKRMTNGKGIPGGGLSLSYDLFRPMPRVVLSVDLGWANEKSSGTWTDGAAADVTSDQLRVGASLRYRVYDFVCPYVHLSAGAGRSRMDVRTGSGETLTDKAGFFQGSLGGGLSFRSPAMALTKGANPWRMGLAVNVEGGYIVGSKTAFTLKGAGAADGEKEPIESVGVPVGAVSRNRPYLRVGIGLVF